MWIDPERKSKLQLAQKNNTIIVLEVKTRSTDFIGELSDMIPPKKIKLLVMAANHYMVDNDLDFEVRFDIVLVHKEKGALKLNHIENAFLGIKRFNYKTNTGFQVSIQNYNGPDINSRIDAQKMIWNDKAKSWQLINVDIRNWEKGNLNYYFLNDTLINIKDINPAIIKRDNIDPEDMNYWEISYFIEKLKNKGLNYTRWSVNKYFKTAFAFTPIIMILFGIALSIRKPRSNFSTGIGFGIVVIFLYYLGIKMGQTLGYNQILPPFLSVWFVNILFLSFGSYIFIKTRT